MQMMKAKPKKRMWGLVGESGLLIFHGGIRRQPADSQNQTNASLQKMMTAMAEKEVSPAQLSTAESLITLVQGKVAGTEGRRKDFSRDVTTTLHLSRSAG